MGPRDQSFQGLQGRVLCGAPKAGLPRSSSSTADANLAPMPSSVAVSAQQNIPVVGVAQPPEHSDEQLIDVVWTQPDGIRSSKLVSTPPPPEPTLESVSAIPPMTYDQYLELDNAIAEDRLIELARRRRLRAAAERNSEGGDGQEPMLHSTPATYCSAVASCGMCSASDDGTLAPVQFRPGSQYTDTTPLASEAAFELAVLENSEHILLPPSPGANAGFTSRLACDDDSDDEREHRSELAQRPLEF